MSLSHHSLTPSALKIHTFQHILDYATTPPIHLVRGEGGGMMDSKAIYLTDKVFEGITQIFSGVMPVIVQLPLPECDEEVDERWEYKCTLTNSSSGCCSIEYEILEVETPPEGLWCLSIFSSDKILDFAGWYNLNLLRGRDVFVLTDHTAELVICYNEYREFALKEGLQASYKIYIRDRPPSKPSIFTLQAIHHDHPVILDLQFMETIGLPVLAAEFGIRFEPNRAHSDMEECVHTPSFSRSFEIIGNLLNIHMIAVIDLDDDDDSPAGTIWEEFTELFCEAHREEKMMLSNGEAASVNKYFLSPIELEAFIALQEFETRLTSKFKNLCSTSNESYRDFGSIQARVRSKILGARKLGPTNI